jgi:Cu+-exporting ATPase
MTSASAETPSEAGVAAECPVCGMEVDPAAARDSLEFGGRTYSFCDRRCRDRFRARPESFLAAREDGIRSPVMLG